VVQRVVYGKAVEAGAPGLRCTGLPLRSNQGQVSLTCAAGGEVLLQCVLFRFRQLARQRPVKHILGMRLKIHARPSQPTVSPSSRLRM